MQRSTRPRASCRLRPTGYEAGRLNVVRRSASGEAQHGRRARAPGDLSPGHCWLQRRCASGCPCRRHPLVRGRDAGHWLCVCRLCLARPPLPPPIPPPTPLTTPPPLLTPSPLPPYSPLLPLPSPSSLPTPTRRFSSSPSISRGSPKGLGRDSELGKKGRRNVRAPDTAGPPGPRSSPLLDTASSFCFSQRDVAALRAERGRVGP